MAYINQQTKKEIMAEVKNVLPAEWKATARILNSMKIVLNLKLDAVSQTDYENYQNEMASAKTLQAKYEIKNRYSALIEKLKGVKTALDSKNYDNSRPENDYFDNGYYSELRIA